MTKSDFIKDLQKCLKYLPKEDRDDAIAYYNEYIDDCGFEENEDISEKVGNPKGVARDIIENCTAKAVEKQRENGSVKGSGKVIWMVLLGIASIPVSLPIAIALTVIVLALLIVIFSVLLALFAAGMGIVAAGIICIIGCIYTPGFVNSITLAGAGLFLMGFGILALWGIVALFKLVIKIIGKIFTRKTR